jgi:hypothetical protein
MNAIVPFVESSSVHANYGVENANASLAFVVIAMKVKCGICGFEADEPIEGRRWFDWVERGAMPKLWICDLHRREWTVPGTTPKD